MNEDVFSCGALSLLIAGLFFLLKVFVLLVLAVLFYWYWYWLFCLVLVLVYGFPFLSSVLKVIDGVTPQMLATIMGGVIYDCKSLLHVQIKFPGTIAHYNLWLKNETHYVKSYNIERADTPEVNQMKAAMTRVINKIKKRRDSGEKAQQQMIMDQGNGAKASDGEGGKIGADQKDEVKGGDGEDSASESQAKEKKKKKKSDKYDSSDSELEKIKKKNETQSSSQNSPVGKKKKAQKSRSQRRNEKKGKKNDKKVRR